jgi:hypothetical protein
MRPAAHVLAISFGAVLCGASPAHGQTPTVTPPTSEDHSIVYELGWAASYSRTEGVHPKGATFAFEVTPIENRLELECGVTLIRASGVTETSLDLLFKKPWTLSKRVEFMAGVGPELIRAAGPERGTFWGLSAIADLMFWSRTNVGWYIEPGYEATFRDGTARHGLAMAGGLIIGR